MIDIVCKYSGLKFQAETKRTKVHPVIARYYSSKDDLTRKITCRILGRNELESAEQFVELFDREYKEETTPEPIKKIESASIYIEAIQQSKTLSELGIAITQLSCKGNWADWKLKYWAKNGECRIYLTDISYTNPKERGYLIVKNDGTYQSLLTQGSFPELPKLPTVKFDLTATDNSPEARAIRSLDSQYGEDGWNQFDYEDELEREEYQ
jgi:hypothetical protein